MNFTLLKNTFRRNWGLLLIFMSVLCLYLGIIISLIDPNDMAQVKELFGTMGSFMDAFGISIAAMTDPLSYTASTFYGLMVMAFTMVYYVMQNTRLIARPVDTGSMAYTLSLPISRAKVVVTQGVYLISAMFLHSLAMFAVGSITLSSMGPYDGTAYLNLVGVTFMLTTAMAMLSFFFSVAFCDSKLGVGLATGIPVGLLILSMLGGAGGESVRWLRQVSPFGWLDSVGIVTGQVSTLWMYFVFGGIIIVFLAASVAVFQRKRLPI